MGGSSFDYGLFITLDDSGNVLITGSFRNTVDFDPGAATFNLTAIGNDDVFIQKLDANGNFIWARSMGGNLTEYGYSIATDASGNVYLTGSYQDAVDFDPGASVFNLVSNGLDEIFVQKLDAGGNFMWATSTGGTGYDYGYSIITDASSNVYITGSYDGTVDFNPGAGTFNLASIGLADVFIQKLDAGGNFVWAKSVGGSSWDDTGNSITIDASGDLLITGSYGGTVDFDPDSATFNLTSNGDLDVFVQKIDAGGNFIWANSFGGSAYDYGYSLTTDTADNVLIIGIYDGTADFDPGAATFNMTSNGLDEIFIEKLDVNGNFIWAMSMGGIYHDYGSSVVTDASNNVYATGSFRDTADFDPGSSNFNLISNGSNDVFILKLSKLPVGIIETFPFNRISIFPNPADDVIHIKLEHLELREVKMMNILGQVIYTQTLFNGNNLKLDTRNLNTGMYFISFDTEAGSVVKKIQVIHTR
ncbi:MAG: SBBP repeat-containing protein [Bacteroidetes bacterium]|nr:SBBP repeat-containing protein [Bacteroidota bacterium]